MSREFYVPCTPYAFPCAASGNVSNSSSDHHQHHHQQGIVTSVDNVGMDCMPLRPGPFHYLISEQAKSLVALQELQNEVGALLEFRDLVIEAFPNLRQKMSSSSNNSSPSSSSNSSATTAQHHLLNHHQNLAISPNNHHHQVPIAPAASATSNHQTNATSAARRTVEWEPGKVRRRIANNNNGSNNSSTGSNGRPENESTSLPRSRSNSQSGGNKHSATVQDSGFSTETSSKDSASTAIARPTSPKHAIDEAEDELWNLLDVIHRKGVRLREEVESLQGRLSVAPEDLDIPSDILEAARKIAHPEGDGHIVSDDADDDNDVTSRDNKERSHQLAILQREKLELLDKVAELEAETLSSRARCKELQKELSKLSALKEGLEDRLRGSLGDAVQRIQPIAAQLTQLQKSSGFLLQRSSSSNNNRALIAGSNVIIKSKDSAFASVKTSRNRFRTRTIEKNVILPFKADDDDDVGADNHVNNVAVRDNNDECLINRKLNINNKLGTLDNILIPPNRLQDVNDVPVGKIAAILREHSSLELQRHLITTTVHNQVLQKRLDDIDKNTNSMSDQLCKAREENEDLRFQLAERNIELEGTRARVRVLERLQNRPTTETDADDESENPLCLDLSSQQNNHNSGDPISSITEPTSQQNPVEVRPSPRRRPSRIPLLGAGNSKPTAPKPPQNQKRSDSKESSLKSLTNRQSSSSSSAVTSPVHSKTKTAKESLNNKDSLNKSLNKSNNWSNGGKESAKDSMNRSLTRSNLKDSLTTSRYGSSHHQQPKDSLETANSVQRRPPAPSRRSQSQNSRSTSVESSDPGKSFSTNPPSSWLSSADISMYPDSLNQEVTSSATGSTRVEFIIGSPTRKQFLTSGSVPIWASNYLDSIDSAAILAAGSFLTDEFPPRSGEGMAECDSLDNQCISSDS